MIFEIYPTKEKLMKKFNNSPNKENIWKKIIDISKELLTAIIYQYTIMTLEIALSFVHPLLGFLAGFLRLVSNEGLKFYPVTDKNVNGKYILRASYRIKGPALNFVKMEVDFGVTKLKNGLFEILDYVRKTSKTDKNINQNSGLEKAIEDSIDESVDEMNELEEKVKKEQNICKNFRKIIKFLIKKDQR